MKVVEEDTGLTKFTSTDHMMDWLERISTGWDLEKLEADAI